VAVSAGKESTNAGPVGGVSSDRSQTTSVRRRASSLSDAQRHTEIISMATPNNFQLSGNAIHISYTTTSIDGKPHFSYHDAFRSLSFTGDEIETVETALGHVVSVRIVQTIDSGSTSFSVLIPRINIEPNQHARVRTEGITTIHRFSLIPAVNHGQLDQYTVTPLHGSASFLVF
jgi:hypothetical protein